MESQSEDKCTEEAKTVHNSTNNFMLSFYSCVQVTICKKSLGNLDQIYLRSQTLGDKDVCLEKRLNNLFSLDCENYTTN